MNQSAYRYQHVVIIDDSRMDILILKETLFNLKFAEHITAFENPIHAFNFLKRCGEVFPDLIFIDLVMPGLSGYKFIERFKQNFSQPTKFAIVSASNDPSDIELSSMEEKIVGYFIKPINRLDLINMES